MERANNKRRRPNFNEDELLVLISEVGSRYNILFSNGSTKVKNNSWEDVTRAVNTARPNAFPRKTQELRRKFCDFRSLVKRKIVSDKDMDINGEHQLPALSAAERAMLPLLLNTCDNGNNDEEGMEGEPLDTSGEEPEVIIGEYFANVEEETKPDLSHLETLINHQLIDPEYDFVRPPKRAKLTLDSEGPKELNVQFIKPETTSFQVVKPTEASFKAEKITEASFQAIKPIEASFHAQKPAEAIFKDEKPMYASIKAPKSSEANFKAEKPADVSFQEVKTDMEFYKPEMPNSIAIESLAMQKKILESLEALNKSVRELVDVIKISKL